MTLFALSGALALVLGLVGFLAITGTLELGPSHETISGTVVSSGGVSISGATVRLTGESNLHAVFRTGFDGHFVFPDVPAGGVRLNVSAPGYQPGIWQLFASPVYTSPQNMQQLSLALQPGPSVSTALHASSSFSDLESLVATEYTGGVVLLVGAIVVVFGILSIWRKNPPGPRAAAAGGAAIGAALTLPILGVDAAFPVLDIPAIVTACLGIAAVAASCLTMATFGMPDEPSEKTGRATRGEWPAEGPGSR